MTTGRIHPISLIVCSRNRSEMLFETLQSILDGDVLPEELIIIDQSDSSDPRIRALEANDRCEVRYYWTNTTGLCAANNLGASLARCDKVAFTHDDVFVERDWFGRLGRALIENGSNAVVTGRVSASAPEVPGGFAPTLSVGHRPAVYIGRAGKDVLKPLNMAMYRSALERVGGFDVRLGPGTRFPGAEDSDLGFRLLEAGYRILYVPEATLYHRAWRKPGDYLPLRWQYGLAQGGFFAKHIRLAGRHIGQRLLRDWIRRLRRFPLRLYREGSRGFGDPIYIAGNITGALRWWKTHWVQGKLSFLSGSSVSPNLARDPLD